MSVGATLYSHTSEEILVKQMEQDRERLSKMLDEETLWTMLDQSEPQETRMKQENQMEQERNRPIMHVYQRHSVKHDDMSPVHSTEESEPQETRMKQENQMEQQRNRPLIDVSQFFSAMKVADMFPGYSPKERLLKQLDEGLEIVSLSSPKISYRGRRGFVWEHSDFDYPLKSEQQESLMMEQQERGLIIQLKKQRKQKKDRLEEELQHMRACIARLEEQLLHAHIERSEPQEKRMKQEDREVAPKSKQQEEQMTGLLLWDDVQSPFFQWPWDKEQLEREIQQLKEQLKACEAEKEQLKEENRKLKAVFEASVSETGKIVISCEDYSSSLEEEESDDTDDNEDNYCSPKQLRENIKKGISESEEYQNAMKSLRKRKNALNSQTVTGE